MIQTMQAKALFQLRWGEREEANDAGAGDGTSATNCDNGGGKMNWAWKRIAPSSKHRDPFGSMVVGY